MTTIAFNDHQVNAFASKLMAMAAERYSIPADFKVAWFDKGTCAGIAQSKDWSIRFNRNLFAQTGFEEFKQTIAHECAHLVVYHLERRNMTRYRPHGREWQLVMRFFGFAPERCHHYAVERKVERRHYTYMCACENLHKVSIVRHSKMQRGVRYTCRKCKQTLLPVTEIKTDVA